MNEPNPAKRGLTLIEVLIALVILSVGVSSLMMAMSRCLATVRTVRNRETARALIQRVDIENPIESVDMDEMSDNGDFDDVEGYAWSRNIVMVDEEERPGLFEVTTRIRWSERGRESFEEITVFKYAPDAESVTSKVQ
ncbi:prepilin-type N-terminal cleavage/methylation domain-containing protein [Pontiella sp.]|uniref:type IV pilus modification PilV family protein n=1 Tax=Pontiella sp. TaxID=2837462 RepID=UPI0035663CC6